MLNTGLCRQVPLWFSTIEICSLCPWFIKVMSFDVNDWITGESHRCLKGGSWFGGSSLGQLLGGGHHWGRATLIYIYIHIHIYNYIHIHIYIIIYNYIYIYNCYIIYIHILNIYIYIHVYVCVCTIYICKMDIVKIYTVMILYV